MSVDHVYVRRSCICPVFLVSPWLYVKNLSVITYVVKFFRSIFILYSGSLTYVQDLGTISSRKVKFTSKIVKFSFIIHNVKEPLIYTSQLYFIIHLANNSTKNIDLCVLFAIVGKSYAGNIAGM